MQAALNLLDKLNPNDPRIVYDQVIFLVLAIYPRLDHQHFIIWLEKSMSEIEARKTLKRVFIKSKGPFSFDLSALHGWILLHYSNSSNSPPGCENITKVPCTYSSSNQYSKSTNADTVIAADIRVGDEILIASQPKVWWSVHEVRPHRNSIMTIRMKQSSHGCGLKGREYQEMYPVQLMGCLVRRAGDMCKNCLEECTCVGRNKQWCFFQFPKIPPRKAAETLLEMAESSSRRCALADEGDHDHLQLMQRGAFVQMWLDKKQLLLEASTALDRIHSSLSMCR